ncbi:helix-hairpin-helix domain-containing protein [Halomonas sp. THAF5a]|uniref:ComEA family DNA-binding protein n=1 Tax=Halomonas sp. THAF5a TaxID=2587844 RepID=UPI0020A6684D|nr:helix-hairpin-helix domain-containing protein [Halomonas sp. THAF5a]
MDHLAARARVSDHAPVYFGINGARLESQLVDGADATTGSVSLNCIDLNAATPSRLEDLPHVGPARAEAIVSGRPWSAPGELTQVNEMEGGRLEEIRASDLLCGA